MYSPTGSYDRFAEGPGGCLRGSGGAHTLGVCASSLTPVAFLAQPTEVLLLRTLAPLAPGA